MKKNYISKYITLVKHLVTINNVYSWMKRNFDSPSPDFVKKTVLKKNSNKNSTWIETGTYLGTTTKFLQKISPLVISIEPSKDYFEFNQRRFMNNQKVKLINGTSEDKLRLAIQDVTGNLNFWLDGHFSGGDTYFNNKVTPILDELQTISHELKNSSELISIFIDDFRLFNLTSDKKTEYPKFNEISNWASINKYNLRVIHDIIILQKDPNSIKNNKQKLSRISRISK